MEIGHATEKGTRVPGVTAPGDVIIGGIFPIHEDVDKDNSSFALHLQTYQVISLSLMQSVINSQCFWFFPFQSVFILFDPDSLGAITQTPRIFPLRVKKDSSVVLWVTMLGFTLKDPKSILQTGWRESSTGVGLLNYRDNCASRRLFTGGQVGEQCGRQGRQRGRMEPKARQVECTSGSGRRAQAKRQS